MRLSLWPGPHQPWGDLLDIARHADRSGWDGIYIADHFMGSDAPDTPTLEATAVLAALARETGTARLGSLVFGNTYRHPAVLANWAATVDHISGGRLVLGVGAGWQVNEHQAYGIELPPPGPRISRFEEACQVLHGLLRSPVTDLAGDSYQLHEATAEPKPVQSPMPLLIGGKGDRMLGIVARYADEWNMWATPELFTERSAALDLACEQAGRDPAAIQRSVQALVLITDDDARARDLVERVAPRPAVAGPPHAFAEMCVAWIDAGVDEVIVPDFTLGSGTRRADSIDALAEATRGLRAV